MAGPLEHQIGVGLLCTFSYFHKSIATFPNLREISLLRMLILILVYTALFTTAITYPWA